MSRGVSSGAMRAYAAPKQSSLLSPRSLGGLRAALESAEASTGIGVAGDSTGNETTEWVYRLAQTLAARYPGWNVRYRLWNDSTQLYDPPTYIQLAAAGERYANTGTTASYLYVPPAQVTHVAGDLDVRVRLAAADWTPAASGFIAGRRGGAGQYGWALTLNTGSALYWSYSVDGTTTYQATSSAVLPGASFVDGQPMWVRVVHDMDNGAGDNAVSFYYSADGVTWTQLGSTRAGSTHTPTNTGAIAGGLFNSNGNYTLGQVGGASPLNAKYYEVEIRNGIDGPCVNPRSIDQWLLGNVAITFGGAPTLDVYNASIPGMATDYFFDTTRAPKIFQNFGQCLTFVSLSHNEQQNIGPVWTGRLDSLLTKIKAYVPTSSRVCMITQNPQIAAQGQYYSRFQARRRIETIAWSALNQCACLDTYQAFLDRFETDGWQPYINTDGVHPNTTGEALWLQTVLDALDSGL